MRRWICLFLLGLLASSASAQVVPGLPRDGRNFTSLNLATLSIDPADSDLVVDNIGSTGLDGVSMDLPGDEGGGLAWRPVTAAGAACLNTIGHVDHGGAHRQLKLAWTPVPGGVEAQPDLSDLGVAVYDLRLYAADGTIVHETSDATGPIGVFDRLPTILSVVAADSTKKKKGNVEYSWKVEEGESKAAPWVVTLPDGTALECASLSLIVFPPEPILEFQTLELRAANVPELRVRDAWLRAYGRDYRGLGDTHVDMVRGVWPDDGWTLTLEGLVVDAPGGVAVDGSKGGAAHLFVWNSLTDLASGRIELSLTGQVEGTAGEVARGWIQGNGGGCELGAEFQLLPGPFVLRYEVDGVAYEQPWTGAPIFAGDPPTTLGSDSACGDAIIQYSWDLGTFVEFPDGTGETIGDLEIASLTPVVNAESDHATLTLEGLPVGFLTGVSTQVEAVSPDGVCVRTLGTARARADSLPNYGDPNDDDTIIDNLGGTGDDGLRFEFADAVDRFGVGLPDYATDTGRRVKYICIQMTDALITKSNNAGAKTRAEVDPRGDPTGATAVLRGVFGDDPAVQTRLQAYRDGALVGEDVLASDLGWTVDRMPGEIVAGTSDGARPEIWFDGAIFEFVPDMGALDGVIADAIRLSPEGGVFEPRQYMGASVYAGRLAPEDADDLSLDLVPELSATGVRSGPPTAVVRLEPNYPNPFNPSTTLAFTLDLDARVNLAVYDLAGRLVRRLFSGPATAGAHEVAWDGRDARGRIAGSGVYLARLSGPSGGDTRRMLLLK